MNVTISSFAALLAASGLAIALAPAGVPRFFTITLCSVIVLTELVGYIGWVMIPLWSAKASGHLMLTKWQRTVLLDLFIPENPNLEIRNAELQRQLESRRYCSLCYLATAIWFHAHLWLLIWTMVELFKGVVKVYQVVFPEIVLMFLSVHLWQPFGRGFRAWEEYINPIMENWGEYLKANRTKVRLVSISCLGLVLLFCAIIWPATTLGIIENLLIGSLILTAVAQAILCIARFIPSTEAKQRWFLIANATWLGLAIVTGTVLWLRYQTGFYLDPDKISTAYFVACIGYVVTNSAIIVIGSAVHGVLAVVRWHYRLWPKQEVPAEQMPTMRINVPKPVTEGAKAVGSWFSDWWHGVCPTVNRVTVPID